MSYNVRAHFDGICFVPDEPVVGLMPGDCVEVVRVTEQAFNPLPDLAALLFNGGDWDEEIVLHVDPLDRVPPDFVRKLGSGAGEIKIAEDFDAIPTEFEGYL